MLAYAPWRLAWLSWCSWGVLMLLCWQVSPRRAFLIGGAFALGLFGFGLHWIYISMYAYGGAPLWFALAANAGLIALLALYPACCCALLAGLTPAASNLRLWAFPLFWSVFELLRAFLFTGFPWLSVGYAVPLRGFAPLFGVYGTGCLNLLAIVALLGLLRRHLPSAALLAFLLSLNAFGWFYPWTQPQGRSLTVALVQGNVDQLTKFDPNAMHAHLQKFFALSQPLSVDIIIWPETAIEFLPDDLGEAFFQELQRSLSERRQSLISGIPLYEQGRYYNAIQVWGAGEGRYAKNKLLPFGEYIPLRRFLGFFADFVTIPYADFSRGGEAQGVLRTHSVAAGASVCYEAVFPSEIRRAMPEAEYLLNISNDGWFRDSIAAHQHLQMNQMRALELGRELLRSTNTGISAFIDHHGRLRAQSALMRQEVLMGSVQPRRGLTPFARYGDALFAAGLLVYAILCTLKRCQMNTPKHRSTAAP